MYNFVVLATAMLLVAGFSFFTTPSKTSADILIASSGPTTPETVDVHFDKHISGEDRGYELSDFSYHVTGNGVDEVVWHDNSIALEVGTYTIEEIVPEGFVKSDWRIGWYGECEAGDTFTTTITIDDGNVDHGTLDCQADNQYRPDHGDGDPILGCTDPEAINFDPEATEDDQSCEYDDIPTTTGSINGFKWNDDGDGEWEDDELGLPNWTILLKDSEGTVIGSTSTNEDGEFWFTDLIPGTYTVCEEQQSSWTQIYPGEDGCHEVAVVGEEVSGDINFGNKPILRDEGDDTFRIEGYVWHDNNENTVWDGFEEEIKIEDEQSGWTVQITNGEDTFTTTTDETGFYYFEVPAGTWTITEVLQEGWVLITPVSGNFVVTVPSSEVLSFGERVWAFIMPTAHAAVIETLGPFNFGNNVLVTTTPTPPSSGGGSGGGGKKIELSGGGSGSSSGSSTPEPEVLGEQVSIVPFGAPDTGAGGTSPHRSSTGLILLFLTLGLTAVGSYRYRTI